MKTQTNPQAAIDTKAFVYTKPDGSQHLAAHLLFDDHQIWRTKDDFDGREEVKMHFPVQGKASWDAAKASYSGRASRYDVHSLALDVGRNHIDVPALLALKLAASAQVQGPRLGAELIHLQTYGDNTPVYDVGPVDSRGINWVSPVTAVEISRTHEAPKTLAPGETVQFSATRFGRPGNLRFDIDVFAPEHSPKAAAEGAARTNVLNHLDINIDSALLPGGVPRRLRYVGNVGPQGNNVRLSISMADIVVGQPSPASGVYPVRITSGGATIAEFNVDWRGTGN